MTPLDFEFKPAKKLEDVPEQFRPLYQSEPGDDGSYSVNPNYSGVAAAINGFNKSNKNLRQELKSKSVDLSPLKDYGEDPQTIAQTIQQRLDELTNSSGDAKKQVESVKAAMQQAHQKEIEQVSSKTKAYQDQLYSLLVENSATTAIAEQKGIPELLIPFLKTQIAVRDVDGRFAVEVVDGQGETRYGATGSPMSIKELVSEMKANEKFGRLFESEASSGGGMKSTAGRAPTRPTGQPLTSAQKIAAGLKKR